MVFFKLFLFKIQQVQAYSDCTLFIGKQGRIFFGLLYFEGNKCEGGTFLPVQKGFCDKYGIKKLNVIVDADLLSNKYVEGLLEKGCEFIHSARI